MDRDLLIIQKTLSIIPSYRSENVTEDCGIPFEKGENVIEKLLEVARNNKEMLERILKETTLEFFHELGYDPELILRHARIHPRWFCFANEDRVILKKKRKELKPIVEARIFEAMLPIKQVLVDETGMYDEGRFIPL